MPLPDTACSQSVRTLLVEVTSLKRRYCLKLPAISRPFLGMGPVLRKSAISTEGYGDTCVRMCGTGHLTWAGCQDNSGKAGMEGGNPSSQTPEEDGLAEALKYHHSVVWHKSHPNGKVSYYKFKHIIIMCLRRLHTVSSFRKWTGGWQDATSCRFLRSCSPDINVN